MRLAVFLIGLEHVRLVVLVRNFGLDNALWSSFITSLLHTELFLQIEAFAVDQPLVLICCVLGIWDGSGYGVLVFPVLEDGLRSVGERAALPNQLAGRILLRAPSLVPMR